MKKVDQVLAEIDALIDDQLAEGEPLNGYDFGDPGFPRCRCGRTWHGLATRACPGSDAEGPQRPWRPYVDVVEVVRCRCGVREHDAEMFGCPGTTVEGPVDSHGAVRAVTEQWAGIVEAARPALDAFRPALDAFRAAVLAGVERSFRDAPWSSPDADPAGDIGRAMSGRQPEMTIVDETHLWLPQDHELLRVQLPRPATTPPMWAVDPTRSRRRRSHQ